MNLQGQSLDRKSNGRDDLHNTSQDLSKIEQRHGQPLQTAAGVELRASGTQTFELPRFLACPSISQRPSESLSTFAPPILIPLLQKTASTGNRLDNTTYQV